MDSVLTATLIPDKRVSVISPPAVTFVAAQKFTLCAKQARMYVRRYVNDKIYTTQSPLEPVRTQYADEIIFLQSLNNSVCSLTDWLPHVHKIVTVPNMKIKTLSLNFCFDKNDADALQMFSYLLCDNINPDNLSDSLPKQYWKTKITRGGHGKQICRITFTALPALL